MKFLETFFLKLLVGKWSKGNVNLGEQNRNSHKKKTNEERKRNCVWKFQVKIECVCISIPRFSWSKALWNLGAGKSIRIDSISCIVGFKLHLRFLWIGKREVELRTGGTVGRWSIKVLITSSLFSFYIMFYIRIFVCVY